MAEVCSNLLFRDEKREWMLISGSAETDIT